MMQGSLEAMLKDMQDTRAIQLRVQEQMQRSLQESDLVLLPDVTDTEMRRISGFLVDTFSRNKEASHLHHLDSVIESLEAAGANPFKYLLVGLGGRHGLAANDVLIKFESRFSTVCCVLAAAVHAIPPGATSGQIQSYLVQVLVIFFRPYTRSLHDPRILVMPRADVPLHWNVTVGVDVINLCGLTWDAVLIELERPEKAYGLLKIFHKALGIENPSAMPALVSSSQIQDPLGKLAAIIQTARLLSDNDVLESWVVSHIHGSVAGVLSKLLSIPACMHEPILRTLASVGAPSLLQPYEELTLMCDLQHFQAGDKVLVVGHQPAGSVLVVDVSPLFDVVLGPIYYVVWNPSFNHGDAIQLTSRRSDGAYAAMHNVMTFQGVQCQPYPRPIHERDIRPTAPKFESVDLSKEGVTFRRASDPDGKDCMYAVLADEYLDAFIHLASSLSSGMGSEECVLALKQTLQMATELKSVLPRDQTGPDRAMGGDEVNRKHTEVKQAAELVAQLGSLTSAEAVICALQLSDEQSRDKALTPLIKAAKRALAAEPGRTLDGASLVDEVGCVGRPWGVSSQCATVLEDSPEVSHQLTTLIQGGFIVLPELAQVAVDLAELLRIASALSMYTIDALVLFRLAQKEMRGLFSRAHEGALLQIKGFQYQDHCPKQLVSVTPDEQQNTAVELWASTLCSDPSLATKAWLQQWLSCDVLVCVAQWQAAIYQPSQESYCREMQVQRFVTEVATAASEIHPGQCSELLIQAGHVVALLEKLAESPHAWLVHHRHSSTWSLIRLLLTMRSTPPALDALCDLWLSSATWVEAVKKDDESAVQVPNEFIARALAHAVSAGLLEAALAIKAFQTAIKGKPFRMEALRLLDLLPLYHLGKMQASHVTQLANYLTHSNSVEQFGKLATAAQRVDIDEIPDALAYLSGESQSVEVAVQYARIFRVKSQLGFLFQLLGYAEKPANFSWSRDDSSMHRCAAVALLSVTTGIDITFEPSSYLAVCASMCALNGLGCSSQTVEILSCADQLNLIPCIADRIDELVGLLGAEKIEQVASLTREVSALFSLNVTFNLQKHTAGQASIRGAGPEFCPSDALIASILNVVERAQAASYSTSKTQLMQTLAVLASRIASWWCSIGIADPARDGRCLVLATSAEVLRELCQTEHTVAPFFDNGAYADPDRYYCFSPHKHRLAPHLLLTPCQVPVGTGFTNNASW